MQIECDVAIFNNWIDSISYSGRAGQAAGNNLRDFSIAIKKLKDNMEIEYRKQVGRLPGSTKTNRLRKKRDKMVSEWYLS